MPSLPYAIFARPSKPVGSSRLHTSRRRRSTRGWASRASAGCRDHGHAPQAGLSGVESLESRTLLDANDVVVSLVGNQVVLTLDKAGATVTNLSTVYAPQVGLLTINAASAGKLSTSGTVSGITIDPGADTIMVDLRVLPTFAGISVVGDAGIDIVTIGPGGRQPGGCDKRC